MKNFAKLTVLVVVVAMSVAVLAGCAPSDYTKAEANLKDAGYTVVTITNETALAVEEGSIKLILGIDVSLEATVVGTTKDDSATAYYFADAKDATAYYDKLKAFREEALEEAEKQYKEGKIKEEEYKEIKEDAKNSKLGKSGKVVYYGTAAGVKAL